MDSLDSICSFLTFHGAKRVALQFPDTDLGLASGIAIAIEQKINVKVFILGDTAYSPCCVDQVAAQHVEADAIVHFGESCNSDFRGLPVMYVRGDLPMDETVAARIIFDRVKSIGKPNGVELLNLIME